MVHAMINPCRFMHDDEIERGQDDDVLASESAGIKHGDIGADAVARSVCGGSHPWQMPNYETGPVCWASDRGSLRNNDRAQQTTSPCDAGGCNLFRISSFRCAAVVYHRNTGRRQPRALRHEVVERPFFAYGTVREARHRSSNLKFQILEYARILRLGTAVSVP